MTGVRKLFNRSLHRANDPPARAIVKKYLKQKGLAVEDNPDQFGVDLISADGTLQLEIEHRLIWTTEEFPYKEVNIPERKAKFFATKSVGYIILSNDYSYIGMISGKELAKHMVKENLHESSNRFVRAGEYFYKIPKDAFVWDKV
jgi:hypothetical protein